MSNQEVTNVIDYTADLKLKGFNVFESDSESSVIRSYSRKDFYKICLVTTGKSNIQYADKEIEIDATYLFFGNPLVPYSAQLLSEKQTGFCLFAEDFLKGHERSESLQNSPLFKIGGTPVLLVTDEQRDFIIMIFRKMLSEQDTEYVYRAELIRNCINLIIHEALKMEPLNNFTSHKNAPSRVTSFFLELLERQFPIEGTERPLQLKTAQDFAKRLSVHVNHLNRSVKEVTGKSTTTHISERIIAEAKALLQHTDWTIAEIAHALGFEYPTYFNNYFKRMTNTYPSSLRAQIV